MGILDRLGTVLKSYINDGAEKISGADRRSRRPWEDDDLNAAYDELDDFLREGKSSGDKDKFAAGRAGNNAAGYGANTNKSSRYVTPEIKAAFTELGLTPDASFDECKNAYKKLLKVHHPDRHGHNPELTQEATLKAAKINAAYDKLVKWFKAPQ